MTSDRSNVRALGRLSTLRIVPYLLAFTVADALHVKQLFSLIGITIWVVATVAAIAIHTWHNFLALQTNMTVRSLGNIDRSQEQHKQHDFSHYQAPRLYRARLPFFGRNGLIIVFTPYAVAFAILYVAGIDILRWGAISLLMAASLIAWEIQFTLMERRERRR